MDFKVFYDNIRKDFPLTNKNVAGFDFIISEALKRKVPLLKLAYILATVWHETAHTMQPIRELGGETYLKSKKYYPYVGMGYVQLTWKENYEKASKKLGVDFVSDPKLLLKPKYAVEILFVGMEEGWFTGKKLDDYIDEFDESDKEDLREYSNARYIVNGSDKQVLIGEYALKLKKALKASGYALEATQKPVESVPEVSSTQVPSNEKTSLWSILVLLFNIFIKR